MYKLFSEIAGEKNVFFNEPMKKHTTFRIGGAADCFIKCNSERVALNVARYCDEKNIPIFIMGNGSNLLIGDLGIRGVVLQLDDFFNECEFDDKECKVNAKSGILLSKLASLAAKHNMSGLECLSGIPGTLGGALYMNAGAYGDEIANYVESVTYIDENSTVKTFNLCECEFGYRKSVFTDSKKIILSAVLKLKPDTEEIIRNRMAEYTEKRVSKQPVEKFSAGSTFKRPEGNYAGTLIEKSGLKGKKIGGAEVSEKHAGFIINNGDASASDVIDLIKYVQDKVYSDSQILLEPEVKIVGDF